MTEKKPEFDPVNDPIMERLRGHPVPLQCPECGTILTDYIGMRSTWVVWDKEGGYSYYEPHPYDDGPDYYCPECNTTLPEEIISALREKLDAWENTEKGDENDQGI